MVLYHSVEAIKKDPAKCPMSFGFSSGLSCPDQSIGAGNVGCCSSVFFTL